MSHRPPARSIIAGLAIAVALALVPPSAHVRASDAPDEPKLDDEIFLAEVVRHLYRWYLDEGDVSPEINRGEFVFWVRELHPELDEGDRSRFGRITLPRLGVRINVKLADYEIPELGIAARSDTFRITSIMRVEVPSERPSDAREVRLAYPAMRDYLFRTRNALGVPSGELLRRLRKGARDAVAAHVAARGAAAPTEPQAIHLGPLSPVANEAWVFWENGRMLVHFTSDIDLTDPAVWAHEKLAVRTYDIDEQVVVSLDEVAGSNAYLTRDHVGRVLFNCLVMGKRVVIEPGDGGEGQP